MTSLPTRWLVAALLLELGCGGSGSPSDASADTSSSDGDMDSAVRVDGARDGGRDGSGDAASDAAPGDANPRDTSSDTSADAPDDAPLGQSCVVDEDLGTATGIGVATGTTRSDTNDLTPECQRPSVARDVVFLWEAPGAGHWAFDTIGSSFDTVLHVRDSECALLACNDNAENADAFNETLSRTDLMLAEGEQVHVVVDGRSNASGAFTLSITPYVEAEMDCHDQTDNDRDGATDCHDVDCRVQDPDGCIEWDCTDNVDNDMDGWLDCVDTDCQLIGEPCVGELSCGDGIDNDDDGLVDCDDPGRCNNREPCIETTCGDSNDNDGDGATDCADPDCGCSLDCIPDPCPDVELGTMLGAEVARGNLDAYCDVRVPAFEGNCHGRSFVSLLHGSGPEVTFQWTAPAEGTYTFDTEGSDFGASLYLLEECGGPELACHSTCGADQAASLSIPLLAGQALIVVLEGCTRSMSGNYVLNIYQE